MKLAPVGVQGELHTPYWFVHGERGDPKQFFDGMDRALQDVLLAAISHYADKEWLGEHRGHPMPWEYETDMDGTFELFKYKVKGHVYRYYAVVHGEGAERKSVIVHGYKAPKSASRKEKDDPREQREKRIAERRARQYREFEECKGLIQ